MITKKHCGYEVLNVEYISGTELVPRNWDKWFWCLISENAPFSWGDNNHTLVSIEDFANHCEERLDDDVPVSKESIKKWLKKIKNIDNNYFVDLET